MEDTKESQKYNVELIFLPAAALFPSKAAEEFG